MGTWTSGVWATEDFRADLRAFVTAAIGPPDTIAPVSVRPWSAVWRVVAGGSTSYAKQNCPGQAHEAALVRSLAAVAPDLVVPVLAADPDRDLLLTLDQGPTLDRRGDLGVAGWCEVVARAAVLQRRSTGLPEVLALTTLAPDDVTTYVADAVGRLSALALDDPRRLAPDVGRRLEALLPLLSRWADRVEDAELPLGLVHNDLHPGNVVGRGGGAREGLRFLDFGDAVRGEPLGNLLVPLDAARRALGVPIGDPLLWRIADAALEVWGDLTPVGALRSALPAALQLARLARVESWRRCVATMTPAERLDFGGAPAGWLATLLEPSPLGCATPPGART